MDFPAIKPVSSVVTSPTGQGGVAVSPAGSGKDLPPPPPAAHLDAQLLQELSQKKAALAQQMSQFLSSNVRDLEFQVDSQSGRAVVTVRDGAGNVVRTIPGEDALQMLRRITVESGTFVHALA